MARFINRMRQHVYEGMLALAADPTSELYLADGSQHRGAMHRCAFWDGYNGMTLTGKTRTANATPDTLSHACWAAGQDFAKIQARKERKA